MPLNDRLKELPEGSILRMAFLGLLAASCAMLYMDVRGLSEANSPSITGTPASQPVRMDRPRDNDQIRPYLPSTRPWAPSEGSNRSGRPRPQGLDEGAPIRFRPVGNGRILAEGTIVPGAFDGFYAFMSSDAGENAKEIVLHSPGGSVDDAIAMARLIREREISTIIIEDGYCASSCPLVFAGGIERTAHATAWIGVHQVYTADNQFGTLSDGMSHAQRVSADAQTLLLDLDVDPRVWVHAMSTPKDQLYLLTNDELVELKLATEVLGKTDEEKPTG